jgi:uncharacterized membrane protein
MEDEMPQYQRSITVDATPDRLFEFLSDVENLPKYFARLTEAHPATGDEVHVKAKVPAGDGEQTVESDATFAIDADRRAISWGSDNEHDYHGELQVTPVGEGASVAVTLHTEHDSEQINDGIDETLLNIKQLVNQ